MAGTDKALAAFIIVILIFVIATLRLIYQIAAAFDDKINGPSASNLYGQEDRSSELMKGFFSVLLFGLLAMLTYPSKKESSEKTGEYEYYEAI